MNQKLKKSIYLGAAFSAAFVLLDALFFEQYFFVIKKYNIGNPAKPKRPIRFIHLTDLHLKNMVGTVYRKLARKINQINPDLLLITGDSIDQTGKGFALDGFLGLLKKTYRKVAILGNHEYVSGEEIDMIKNIYNKHQVKLLVNESKVFFIRGEKIVITGLDDLLKGKPDFSKAVNGVGYENNHLVLIHTPALFDRIKEEIIDINATRHKGNKLNISYFFAGHTHGGQITFQGYAPLLPQQSGGYVAGWYSRTKPFLYLSAGFGTSSVPFRFGPRSEITVFNYYS